MTLPEDRPEPPSTTPAVDDPIITRGEFLTGIGLFVGVLAVIGAVLVLMSDTGQDIPGTVAASGSGTPSASGPVVTSTGEGSPLVVPQNGDEQAIENLGRLSIILLPLGDWPQLYNDFTADFQARCTEEEFAQAGVDSAEAQGGNLQLLAFKGLRTLAITGDTAEAVIVGEVRGASEYEIGAAFAKVEGSWKLAPAAGTSGCSAFTRVSG